MGTSSDDNTNDKRNANEQVDEPRREDVCADPVPDGGFCQETAPPSSTGPSAGSSPATSSGTDRPNRPSPEAPPSEEEQPRGQEPADSRREERRDLEPAYHQEPSTHQPPETSGAVALMREESQRRRADRTELRWSGPGQLVYEPTLHQVGPNRFVIEGKRESDSGVPWGFWGGVLVVVTLGMMIAGAQNFYSLSDMLLAGLTLAVGFLLYHFGRRSSLGESVLCEIDAGWGRLRWPAGALPDENEERVLGMDSVTEVVFGMTRLPVASDSRDVRVDAFTLLVRTEAEELIPIIEGSPYKGEVHEIAKFVAELTGEPLTYVGRGIKG